MPNAGFNAILGLVMTAFLLICGYGKSSRPGVSALGRGAHENAPGGESRQGREGK